MKLYRFYLKPPDSVLKDKEAHELSLEDKYSLYAFTTSKKIRNEFIATRNMDRFIEMKSNIDKDDYTDFANRNLLRMLKRISLTSSSQKSKVDPCEIPVLSTQYEKDIIEDSIEHVFETEVDFSNIFPYVFKDKYLRALSDIGYLFLWKLYASYYFEKCMTKDQLDELDEPPEGDFIYDELAFFVMFYSDILDY